MKDKYLEMKAKANKIEELRQELYQNKEHRALQDEDIQYIDDKLFHVQSELRDIFEFCMIAVIE